MSRRKSKPTSQREKTLDGQIREYIRELGRQGGKKRSQNLSPERRREIAKKAAGARWANLKVKKADS